MAFVDRPNVTTIASIAVFSNNHNGIVRDVVWYT